MVSPPPPPPRREAGYEWGGGSAGGTVGYSDLAKKRKWKIVRKNFFIAILRAFGFKKLAKGIKSNISANILTNKILQQKIAK